ncbi:MAG: hypothetical protein HY619_03020 [Thaumarchaeota archaeon]|nr:hypothetical protein [Nitrososphaerota archaeon]
MTKQKHWILASGLAVMFIIGLTILFIKHNGRVRETTIAFRVQSGTQLDKEQPVINDPAVEQPKAQKEEKLAEVAGTKPVEEKQETADEEKPIEEVLAQAGEDPGAVFYMSRVREALKESNPKFARELLRQMKELHPKSILVSEAEILFEERR